MDVIELAIKNKRHITKYSELANQTWNVFNKELLDKKLFLFGLGDGADYFLAHCNKDIKLEGALDNDKKKQGLPLNCFFSKKEYEDIRISDIEELSKYTSDEVIVLITNLVHYEQIYEQLKEYGIKYIYSLLMMEKNNRQVNGQNPLVAKTEVLEETPIDKNKMVFYTMGGYSGHGKYIAEEILRHRSDLDMVWIVNDMSLSVPKGIRLVYEKNTLQYKYEMETSKIWVFEWLVPQWIEKKPEQIYIQVKHWASVTLKKFALDVAKYRNDAVYINLCKKNGKQIDYIFVGSHFDETSCRSGFGYEGEVYYTGSPRSDILYKQVDFKSNLFNEYQINGNAHLLLYAPTFRAKKENFYKREVNTKDIDFKKIKQVLEKTFGGEWYILLRLHPLVRMESYKYGNEDYLIDVSDYSDSQELVSMSDIMITDYSSLMFEPAFVRKPVFLLAADKKEYVDKDYEVLIPYDTLPFSIAETNDELIKNIENFNQTEYEEAVTDFLDKYGVHEDGHASERAADFILDLLNKERI